MSYALNTKLQFNTSLGSLFKLEIALNFVKYVQIFKVPNMRDSQKIRESLKAWFEYWIRCTCAQGQTIPAGRVSLETTKKCLQNQLRLNTKITILLFQNNLLIMKHQRISKRDGDILMLQHFFDFSQFFVVFLMFFIFFTKLMFSNWFFVISWN